MAGCTNIGIRRTTPSESVITSVEARITLLSGVWHGTLGLVSASAHQNSFSGIWSSPAGFVFGETCWTYPSRDRFCSPG